MYHDETVRIYERLLEQKQSFSGGTQFSIGGLSINVESKE